MTGHATPLPMKREADRAGAAFAINPHMASWRGDVREPDGRTLVAGGNFNLVDDIRHGPEVTLRQYRVLQLVAAPEGYIAVLAVESTAVASQLPSVRLSHVIKHSSVPQEDDQ